MKREPIPKHFKSVEEAGEFWDSHDLADYWDLTSEAHFDVAIQQRVFLVAKEDNVMLLERATKLLNVAPEKLEQEGLQAYLERNLRLVESELLMLAQRYGVQTVEEFDNAIQTGHFHEKDTFEEFFRFDYLENERQTLRELLEQL